VDRRDGESLDDAITRTFREVAPELD